MERIVRLTERDLTRLVKKIIMEALPIDPNINRKPRPKEGDYGVYCVKSGDSLTSIANKFKGQYGLSNDDPISDILNFNEYYRQIFSKLGKKQNIGSGFCLYLYAAG
jgi:hypothetical protein